jgi:LmbE family N-acetylglucosaminyl deacetylase
MSRREPIRSPLLAAAAAAGEPLLFLSAHLDDAVLSCGALIATMARRCPLTVATVFTAAGAPPHTHAARSFLRQCSAPDAGTLFADRRTEDRDVLVGLGVHHVHLGATDALFRTRDPRSAALGRLGRVVPELMHRYPTYRYDIAKGRVASGDRALIAALTGQVTELMSTVGARLVLCPVGVGNHVDHLITRTLGAHQAGRVIYYSDFPYDRSAAPDRAFLDRHRLAPWIWDEGIAAKRQLIRGYRTQADALFPDGEIPEQPETYFEASPL